MFQHVCYGITASLPASTGIEANAYTACVCWYEVVCMVRLQAAEEEHRRLTAGGIMGPDVRYGLLHGRLSAEEKAAALEAFATGATNVLIATTVVEVSLCSLNLAHTLVCHPIRLNEGWRRVDFNLSVGRWVMRAAANQTPTRAAVSCCQVSPEGHLGGVGSLQCRTSNMHTQHPVKGSFMRSVG